MHGDGVFVQARFDSLSVMIPAAHVERIAELTEAERADPPPSDLARLLGIPPAEIYGKALLLEAGGVRRWLLVGAHIAMRRVEDEAFVGVPSWLSAVVEHLPFAALVRVDEHFAFELDVHRLVESA